MMVAAHTNDLLAAAQCRAAHGHIARPNEHGPGKGEAAPKAPVDVAANSLEDLAARLEASGRAVVVTALGFAQLLGWGTSFYFPAVFAGPIVADTGWSLAWVVGGVAIGLFVAGLISPRIGVLIDRRGGRLVLAASSLLFAAGLAIIGRCAHPAGVSVRLDRAWASRWARACTMRRSRRSASSTAVPRATRSPTSRCSAASPRRCAGRCSAFMIEDLGWRGACFVYAASASVHRVAAAVRDAERAREGRMHRRQRGSAAGGSARTEARARDADPRVDCPDACRSRPASARSWWCIS